MARLTEGKLRACITLLLFDRVTDLDGGSGSCYDSVILSGANKTVQTEDLKRDFRMILKL